MKIKIIKICFECKSNPSSSIHGHISSYYAKISYSEILGFVTGGPKCKMMLQNLSIPVNVVQETKLIDIGNMAFYNRWKHLIDLGNLEVDFLCGLPDSKGYTVIMVVVDRFSKMIHLIPFKQIPDAKQTAKAFMNNVYKLHGLPYDMYTDRGPQFTK